MKKLIIGLTLLASMSSYGDTTTCEFIGKVEVFQQTLSAEGTIHLKGEKIKVLFYGEDADTANYSNCAVTKKESVEVTECKNNSGNILAQASVDGNGNGTSSFKYRNLNFTDIELSNCGPLIVE